MPQSRIQRHTLRILQTAALRELPTRISCKSKPEEQLIGGKWLGHLPAILDLVEDGFLRCEVAARNSKGKPYHIHNLRITERGYDKLFELRAQQPMSRLRRGIGKAIVAVVSHLVAALIGYGVARIMGSTP
jgi:hypothetical protein